jgi:hypothetical protein
MVDQRLHDLREAILKVLAAAPGGLTGPDLEQRLRAQGVIFWPGEVQEVAWRLTASRNLNVAASGAISSAPSMLKRG